MKFKEFRVIYESNSVEGTMRKKFPEVRLVMQEFNSYCIMQVMLIQEKRRGQGEAKAFMKELIQTANKQEKDIYLSASDVYGGDISKLKKFYKSLGFVKNNGKISDEELVKKHG